MRGNHHDAWVNGAEDPISGLVADAGGGAGPGRAAEAGLEAEAHDRLLRLGRRGADAARLDRVGRGTRRRAAAEGRRLRQHRRQRPRLPLHGRVPHARALHERRRAGRAGPGSEGLGVEAVPGQGPRRRRLRRGPQAPPRAARPAPGRPRLGQRLHRLHRPPRRRQPEPRLRRRGRRRDLPLDLRRLLLVHALLRHRLRLRARPRADGRARRPAARRRGAPALRVRRPGRRGGGVPEGPEEAPRAEAGGDRRAQPPDRGRRLPGHERPAAPHRRAAP